MARHRESKALTEKQARVRETARETKIRQVRDAQRAVNKLVRKHGRVLSQNRLKNIFNTAYSGTKTTFRKRKK